MASKTIDEYISAYDGDLKERMITLRALIHSCHPDLTEKIADFQRESKDLRTDFTAHVP